MARHTYRCAVRWFDMDAFGHVNNVTFLRYLEEARMDFAQLHSSSDGSSHGVDVSVVAHHDVTYLRPLGYRSEPVTVEMWFTELGERSFTIAYEIKDRAGEAGADNGPYVRAQTVMVAYSLASSSSRAMRPDERATIASYLEPLPQPA